jgi:uridine kinase
MIIAVTGLMRTGTSAVTEILHTELGVPMGTLMRFPLQNDYAHLEWEDEMFSSNLLAHLLTESFDIDHFFRDYISSRQGEVWGAKSPFLLPYIDEFVEAGEDAGHEVRIVQTAREIDQTIESLKRQAAQYLENVVEIQKLLIPHIQHSGNRADLIVPFSMIRYNRTLVKSQLKGLLAGDSRWVSD